MKTSTLIKLIQRCQSVALAQRLPSCLPVYLQTFRFAPKIGNRMCLRPARKRTFAHERSAGQIAFGELDR